MPDAVCVIQGDIRRGTDLVLQEMVKHFPKVILSTWKGEEHKAPRGNYEMVLNDKPENPGITHRNFQRLSTVNGIKAADTYNPEYLLKWRTDLLPTRFDLPFLIKCTNWNVPNDVNSRLVMTAFRTMAFENDWFSSFQDLYAFGGVEEMKMLWNDDEFDYNKNFNIPRLMIEELHPEFDDKHLIVDGVEMLYKRMLSLGIYDAHTELYAFYKDNLINHLERKVDHLEICKKYLYLIDKDHLKVCWFRNEEPKNWKDKIYSRGFRSILQSFEMSWNNQHDWKNENFQIYSFNKLNEDKKRFKRRLNPILLGVEFFLQNVWFKNYQKRKNTA